MSNVPVPGTAIQQLKDGLKGAVVNIAQNTIDITNAATTATTEIAKNTLGAASGVTSSALGIVKNSSKIAEEVSNMGLIAAQQSSEHVGKTVGEGAKSLSIIAQTANSILGSVKSTTERVQSTIEAANKRRSEINEQKQQILNKSSETIVQSEVEKNKIQSEQDLHTARTKAEISKSNLDAEAKKSIADNDVTIKKKLADYETQMAETDAKLKSDLAILKIKEEQNALQAKKLQDKFEQAQIIYNTNNAKAKTNIFIATHSYGYKDRNMRYKGWTKGPFLPFYHNYGVFYKISKITKDDNTVYEVSFDLPDESNPNTGGYYYIEYGNKNEKYRLNIKNVFSREISGNSIIKLDDPPTTLGNENDKYNIEVEKVWFKIPGHNGGRKTKNKKRRSKQNRRRTKRNKTRR